MVCRQPKIKPTPNPRKTTALWLIVFSCSSGWKRRWDLWGVTGNVNLLKCDIGQWHWNHWEIENLRPHLRYSGSESAFYLHVLDCLYAHPCWEHCSKGLRRICLLSVVSDSQFCPPHNWFIRTGCRISVHSKRHLAVFLGGLSMLKHDGKTNAGNTGWWHIHLCRVYFLELISVCGFFFWIKFCYISHISITKDFQPQLISHLYWNQNNKRTWNGPVGCLTV